jgi:predicted ribosome quality control (RQC) complex YloA/Tae2 family protein
LLPPLQRNNTIEKFENVGGEEHQSLDFKTTSANLKADHANLTSLSAAQKEQSRKTKEAAEYRAKLLQQSNKQGTGEHSPGAAREKAAMQQYKQRRADIKSQDENSEHKATFMQCIFNLANILMVRRNPDV